MQTKIYLGCVGPLTDERLYQKLYAAASEERRKKTDRYRFLKDRLLSVGAEALLMHALSELGFRDTVPQYGCGKNKKPFLRNAEGLCFNLSHSGEYAMLAVSDAEIGCDIERIRPAERLARRVLTPEEYALYEACGEGERNALFCRFWVCKESYMKATGKGLTLNPASFAIVWEPEKTVLRNGREEPYALWEGDGIPGYRYALCRRGIPVGVETETVRFEMLAEELRNENGSEAL